MDPTEMKKLKSMRTDLRQRMERAGIAVLERRDITEDRVIAKGGYGRVIMGTLKSDGSPVVIKRMLDSKYDVDKVKLFAKETKLLSTIKHPNIVSLLAVCIEPTSFSPIMEFMEFNLEQLNIHGHCKGNTLAELIDVLERANLVEEIGVKRRVLQKAAVDVVTGLAFIHHQNICHRDVNPANILVTNTGESFTFKLTDFGEGRATNLQTVSVPREITDHVRRGTIRFFSPEQIMDSLTLGDFTALKRIDVWSCGMVIFCLISPDIMFPWDKDLPSEANPTNQYEMLKKRIADRQLPTGSHKYNHVADETGLGVIFHRCCNFDPESRPDIGVIQYELNNIIFSQMNTGRSQAPEKQATNVGPELQDMASIPKPLPAAKRSMTEGTTSILSTDAESVKKSPSDERSISDACTTPSSARDSDTSSSPSECYEDVDVIDHEDVDVIDHEDVDVIDHEDVPYEMPPRRLPNDHNVWEGVAICDFCATVTQDLNLKKGDRVKVLTKQSDGEPWSRALNIRSKETGFVPLNHVAEPRSLLVHEWYHGNISPVEARTLLTSPTNPIGSYLVRGEQGSYELMILTVAEGGRKRVSFDYEIKQLEDGTYSMAPLAGTFFHIPVLILCCKMDNSQQLCQPLRKPCPRLHPDLPDLSSLNRTSLYLPKGDVQKGEKLAKGNFASVWLGFWKRTTKVAIKQVKNFRWSREKLKSALGVMKTLRHPNIVRLYGICEAESLLIVMELLECGSLRDYLRSEQGTSLELQDLLHIGKQIASGMAYIEDKGVTHRDLAAKNVLVGANNTVKIADCGLVYAVDEDYVEVGGIFPVRWCAPEVIEFKHYSTQSDVWAYAIVLVEITTHGQLPYKGLTNFEVVRMMTSGTPHVKPARCPDDLYSMMVTCWATDPKNRPSFRQLATRMASLQHSQDMNMQQSSMANCYIYEKPDPATRIVVAMHNFSALDDGELSFLKGDKLEVITADTWIFARHLGTGKEGYIPANYVREDTTGMIYDWYYPDVTRTEAEQMLKSTSNSQGTFLIRTSGSDTFSLSLLAEKVGQVNNIKHYKIELTPDGRFYIATNMSFADLKSLVKHYSENEGLACGLGKACQKPRPVVLELSVVAQDTFELDRKDLQIETKLAAGCFGEVWKGLVKGTIPVAIKKSKMNIMLREDFMKEAAIMKKLDHPNIVRLYGVCSDDPIYIVTEFLENGSLLEYLREDVGPSYRIPFESLVYVTQQVASGMTYLEDRNYIHRDLAARNILVSSNNVVKVADFGMARAIPDAVYVSQKAEMPVRWTAPEGLSHRKFSVKSDVWSFGILMVEIISRGGNPYPGMSNIKVLSHVMRGGRHPQPPGCPDEIYMTMQRCWKLTPSERPSFKSLHEDIGELLSDLSDIVTCEFY